MKTLCRFFLCLIGLLTLVQCASFSKKVSSVPLFKKDKIKEQTPYFLRLEKVDEKKTYQDIATLRKVLQAKRALTEADWQLHDSLLETYKQLKYRPRNGLITVPSKTRLQISLKSYCLDGRKAQPEPGEVFHWQKSRDQFLYLDKLLKLSEQKAHSQETLQNIIWNLQNKTVWEQYPPEQQKILKSIDPEASVKLPSEFKSRLQEKVLKEARSQMPGQVREAVELIEGRYHEYEDFKQILEQSASNKPLPPVESLSAVEDTSLYVETQLRNYDSQEIFFYNPADKSHSLNLFDYYQSSYREDVQPLAAYSDLAPHENLLRDLERFLFAEVPRLGMGFIPMLGDLIDLYEAASGRNFFNDEWLTSEERFMSAMGVLAGSGSSYRYANKVLHGPPSYVRDVEKKYRLVKNTESYKSLEKLSKEVQGKGIPDDWRVKVSKPKDNQGLEYIHPENDHLKVRVMPGKPTAPHGNSRQPYIRITKSGKHLNKYGQTVGKDSAEAHIPLDEFDFSKIRWEDK